MFRLRDLRLDDAQMVRSWRNHPEVAKFMYTDHEITPEEHEQWFRRALNDPTSRFWIISGDGGDLGLLSISQIDLHNRRCFWAFYLDPTARGKGGGAFAEYSVLQHVFTELQLNKLCGEVLGFNRSVIKMHKRFGFVEEGVLRKQIFKQGQWHDVVCVGILREEWEARRPEVEARLHSEGIIG